jgi:hypothetical protein
VLVIDSNTATRRWRPVEAHCATLGARFHFFHVARNQLQGRGAHYALRRTARDIMIIAGIGDYVVDPTGCATSPDVRGSAHRDWKRRDYRDCQLAFARGRTTPSPAASSTSA